jgi:hypothetical protein
VVHCNQYYVYQYDYGNYHWQFWVVERTVGVAVGYHLVEMFYLCSV